MGVEVRAADGRRWTVQRRFRWPRLRLFGPDERHDFIALSGARLRALGFIILVIAVVVFFVLPLFVFITEVVVALVAVLFLRGTWIVEAKTDGPPPEARAWRVHGPFRSKRVLEEVASDARRRYCGAYRRHTGLAWRAWTSRKS